MFKKLFKGFLIIIIIFTFLTSLLTPQKILASADKKYLIIVGQPGGSFKAYDNLAVDIKGHIMVKAKPLASILDAKYSVRKGSKKGCVLESGNASSTFTRNSKTVIYQIGDTLSEYEAPYKQCLIDSYNMIYYDAISPFMNVSYYPASKAPEYKKLGYTGGVIVYNIYEPRPTLPNTSSISVWNGKINKDNLKTNPVTLYPTVRDKIIFQKYPYKSILVEFYQYLRTEKNVFDYQSIYKLYKESKYEIDGIYALGYCNDTLNIQGLDSSGKVLKEYTTADDVFLIDLPNASKLCIINITDKDPSVFLSFTPVKPTIITSTSRIPFSKINWLTYGDIAEAFFVLSEYIETTTENFYTWNSIGTRYVEMDKPNNNSTNNSYSLVTVTIENIKENLIADNIYFNFTKRVTIPLIDNDRVIVFDDSKDRWAPNYEDELTRMMDAVKHCGTNNYFPSDNFDNQVLIRSQSVMTSRAGDEQIVLTPENFNLDCADDYITHLHELTHYYEAQNSDYGWMISAWPEGIAEALSRQTLNDMGIKQDDSVSQFEKVNLTPKQAEDFESYYLSLESNWIGDGAAYNLGYHFITYLQKTYGSDIVYKIYCAEMEANIPQQIDGYYCRDDKRDKIFTGIIKSLTSQNVFQDFVTYYQDLK